MRKRGTRRQFKLSHSSRTDSTSHTSFSRLQLSFFAKPGPALRSGGHTRFRTTQLWKPPRCAKLGRNLLLKALPLPDILLPFHSAWKTVRLRLPFTSVPTVAATAGYILPEFSFSQNAMVDSTLERLLFLPRSTPPESLVVLSFPGLGSIDSPFRFNSFCFGESCPRPLSFRPGLSRIYRKEVTLLSKNGMQIRST